MPALAKPLEHWEIELVGIIVNTIALGVLEDNLEMLRTLHRHWGLLLGQYPEKNCNASVTISTKDATGVGKYMFSVYTHHGVACHLFQSWNQSKEELSTDPYIFHDLN